MKTFKALGALLAYPEQELLDALGEIEDVIEAEGLLPKAEVAGLLRLTNTLRNTGLMALQERYVDSFDRVKSLSLHLFEHVHGESRDRGQAMVDLNQLYAKEGLMLAKHELPDFLPAFLEYLSLLPHKEAVAQLEDTIQILDGIGARLAKRGSHYAAVFNALLRLAGQRGTHTVIDDAEIRREDDPAEIDKLWAEQPAFGGSPGGAPRQATVSVIQFDRTRRGATP
jgi:nitrate reductase molybdenum cofactor assembly chaperone NarJ/NarW